MGAKSGHFGRAQQQKSPLAIRLVLLAACVRSAYLLLVVGFSHLIKDYDTSASLLSESCSDNWPEETAAAQQYLPGVVWDAVFLHRVSACGYEYEQFFAFYPGLPLLVRLIRSSGLLQGPFGFCITALALNSSCFLLSVWLLTKLGQQLVQDDKLAATAVLLFIASPASIHHSMLYTEALFTATSWLGLYFLYCWGSSFGASLAFAASSAVRSNGLLNAGFILHEHGRRTVADLYAHHWASALKQVATASICTVVCVTPYFYYMWFSYNQFCTGLHGKEGPYGQRPWCTQTIPSAYGYVQRVYWMVGFLKYYEVNQIPNFLLAGPTLVISLWGALAYAAANPHVFFSGGLLPQPLLHRWFGQHSSSSSSSRANGSNGSSSSSASCNMSPSNLCSGILSVLVVGSEVYCVCGKNLATGVDDAAAVVKAPTIPGVAFQPLRVRQQEVAGHKQGQQQQQQGLVRQGSGGQQQQQQGLIRHGSGGQLQQQQVLLRQGSGGGGDSLKLRAVAAAAAGPRQPVSRSSSRSSVQHGGDGTDAAGGCRCDSNAAFYRPELAVFVVHWLVLTLVCLAVVHIQVSTRFLSSCAPLYWFAALFILHKGALLRWLLWWYCFAFMGVGAVMFTNFLPWT